MDPHPNLLPQGEGTAASCETGFADNFPLPVGEGWGEGHHLSRFNVPGAMNQFNKIPRIVQIWFGELLAINGRSDSRLLVFG
jgi:hypothetical protein